MSGPALAASTTLLECRVGDPIRLEPDRWSAPASSLELALLDELADPVLDVGCGPGRIVAALAERGRAALGIDASAHAVDEARRRGAAVLCRSVFDPLPGTGRWGAVVMLDGNIGIGGDADRLLQRTRALLAPGGTTLVEVGAPGTPTDVVEVRVRVAGSASSWFPWARLSADAAADRLGAAGLVPTSIDRYDDRWFARAVRR